MDIARPDLARKRRRQRLIVSALALAALVTITALLARLKPAAPAIDRGTLVIGTVERGLMLRQVRGNGTLVPEEIRWVPTANQGRVDKILVLPGTAVQAETVLVELSDPVLEQAAFDAQFQLKAAEADFANLRVQLESQRLTQQAAAATAEAGYQQALMDFEVNQALAKDGLVPAITLKQSQSRAEELKKLTAIEQERLRMQPDSARAQLAAHEAKLEQVRAYYELKRKQVDLLKIRAGLDGVLQKLGDVAQLQVGQQLPAGANVARVANPARLKAEIKIPETQARDIEFGQSASIDTRNGVVAGRVVRIDPAAQNGTVTVDVTLEGALPKGARPDLNVDGIVELERLPDVLHTGRMVNGQPESTQGLFKVIDGGKSAVRVPVKLGRSSVSHIEIQDGLQAGDQVILSDMSNWDAYNRVRLN